MTISEASRTLGIAKVRVKTLLREGKLKGEKEGRNWVSVADDSVSARKAAKTKPEAEKKPKRARAPRKRKAEPAAASFHPAPKPSAA